MKKLLFLALLAASFAVPYFLFEARGVESLVDRWYGRDGTATHRQPEADLGYDLDEPGVGDPYPGPAVEVTTASYRPNPLLEVAPIVNLEDVLNFNVNPPWVLSRWPQVTTGLKKDSWFGYRVPLVTGTDDNDVTGSLTYYFGTSQQLEQITLEGDTGDGRRLVNLLTSQLGLQPVMTTEEGVYLYRKMENENVVSQLRLRPASSLTGNRAGQRFSISLVLNRPAPPRKSFFWSR